MSEIIKDAKQLPDPAPRANPLRRLRFKASGNPGGRPKGARNRKTILKAVAFERQRVTENGKLRSYTTLEVIILRLRNLALEGKTIKAIEAYHKLLETYQPQADGKGCGYLVAPALISEADFIAEMEMERAEKPRRKPRHSRG